MGSIIKTIRADMLFYVFVTVVLNCILLVVFAHARHVTCDQPDASEMVSQYKVELNGTVSTAGTKSCGDNQLCLYYNIDSLPDGNYTIRAIAGNKDNFWSDWSEPLMFRIGVLSPQKLVIIPLEKQAKRLSQENWKVYHVSSEEAEHKRFSGMAIDGDTGTRWHSNWTETNPKTKHPHEIQIDLGAEYSICGFFYLPRQDASWNDGIKDYVFYVSVDGVDWKEVGSGELAKTKKEQLAEFDAHRARYVSLVALSEVNGNEWTTIAELNLLGVPLL